MPPRSRNSSQTVVIRTTESSGSAKSGWEAAIRDAVRSAKRRRVVGFEVVQFSGDLRGGRITTYRVTVRVAYRENVVSA